MKRMKRIKRSAPVLGAGALALVLVLPACSAPTPVPPLPDDPARWVAEADAPVWTGDLPGGLSARFEARRATVRWRDGAPHGRFEGVDLHLWTAGGEPVGRLWAKSGTGTWPDGPLELSLVGWDLLSPVDRGSLDVVTWAPGGRWSCGGCALEGLLP